MFHDDPGCMSADERLGEVAALLLLARGRYHSQNARLDGFGQVLPGGDNLGQVGRHFGRRRGVLAGALKRR